MPYIVTATTPCPACRGKGTVLEWGRTPRVCICQSTLGRDAKVTRTAVATLDEAREAAEQLVRDAYGQPEGNITARAWPLISKVDALPESGGTIGPLPDGTVIEVRPITAEALYKLAGRPASARYCANPQERDAAIAAAFNEAQR